MNTKDRILLIKILQKLKKAFPDCKFYAFWDNRVSRYCFIFADYDTYFSKRNKGLSKILHKQFDSQLIFYFCFMTGEGILHIKRENHIVLSKI